MFQCHFQNTYLIDGSAIEKVGQVKSLAERYESFE